MKTRMTPGFATWPSRQMKMHQPSCEGKSHEEALAGHRAGGFCGTAWLNIEASGSAAVVLRTGSHQNMKLGHEQEQNYLRSMGYRGKREAVGAGQ